MKKSKRLEPISRLAEIKEQQAARLVGDYRKTLEEQSKQLESLKEYREGYLARYQTVSMGARQLADYRLFLDKLNRAIEEQEQLIANSLNAVHDKEKLWTSARSHNQGMQKLVEKAGKEELTSSEKREQSELDDRSRRGKEQG